MNKVKYILIILVILGFAVSCEKEIDNLDKVDNVTAPKNLTATFDITQDNTGLVTIMPTAEGAAKYLVTFGDVEDETPTEFAVHETISHNYAEGVFTLGITAMGITGLTASYEQELNVTFVPPENLDISWEQDPTSPNVISVSAKVDFATIVDFYFGDVPNEEPIHALPEEVVTHTYQEPGVYTITAIAKSGGEATTSDTVMVTIPEASDPVNLPIDFESFTINYAFTDFGGAVGSVSDNPDQSGLNTSNKVGQFNKPSGAETWAGTYLTVENPIDFSFNKIFKVNVWSPKANAIVKLKVENLDNGDIWYEVDALTTVSNQWEELSYDFSGIDINEEYQKVVLFFDFDNPGDDSIYYFDDVKLVSGGGASTLPVEDFEGDPPIFTGFGNATAQVVSNPDPTGVNTTANVAEFLKPTGAETWAGVFFDVGYELDMTNYTKIRINTWSPKVGAVVKLKIENSANQEEAHEVDLNTTALNSWEELVYDFSGAPDYYYDRVVIFFDFGNPGDDATYYFDEIELVNEGGGGGSSLTFEDFEGVAPAFTGFGNASSQVIGNPDPSGVNTTANVADFIKPSGAETWAGVFFDLGYTLDLNNYSKIGVKTWSPKVGAVVKLKLENSANQDEFHEVDLNTTSLNAWEELVYDFSGAPDYSYDRVVIFFDFGNPGDDTIYYFDEFVLTN